MHKIMKLKKKTRAKQRAVKPLMDVLMNIVRAG
jgi:hypothetical protein